jgi:hypothetical protein
MNDQEILDRAKRAAMSVDGSDQPYDALLRRRDRKRRNQRIAAGVVGIAVFVAAVWIVTSVGSFDRTQTPAVPGWSETGPTEAGPSVAPDPDADVITGLPPEGATPSTPKNGELVVELNDPTIPDGSHDRVWVYADGRVISRVYAPTLEPYSGLVEQHLTPEGVEFLRSNVLSTGLFEHDLDLEREDPYCCLVIRVRDGDRLVRVTWGPRYALSDHQAPIATPEQATALQSLSALLTSPASWPASAWADQQIRPYVPTSYSFCSRWAKPSRVLALLPERAGDLLGAGYPKTDGSEQQVDCSRMTTEEARALVEILIAEVGREGGPSLRFSLEKPQGPRSYILIALNPFLPHGQWAWLAGLG